MSSNARKAIGGNIKRLIVRERGDTRAALLAKIARIEALQGGNAEGGSVHESRNGS